MVETETVIERVRRALHRTPARRRVVAYSGGVDSSVLLHALATYGRIDPATITALHVDHALQASSGQWAARCRERAARLGVACEVHTVTDQPTPGVSLETWARQLRYTAFERELCAGDVLWLAHHRDDQAETVLLRLMRGAGPDGLTGMPAERPLGRGTLQRPLLDVDRRAIEAYATAHGLDWIDDPSNTDVSHDRNFVRHRVLPALRTRWPAAAQRIVHTATLQAEAAEELNAQADRELARQPQTDSGVLDIAAVLALSPAAQRRLLRRWLDRLRFPLPGAAQLHEIQRAMLARPDREPVVRYGSVEIRRYRGLLYAAIAQSVDDDLRPRNWVVDQPLRLDWGELRAVAVSGDGVSRAALHGREVQIRFRRGGERCRPAGRGHSHSLKHLFQEWGVPPWQRRDMPLIFVDGELAAVPGYCTCEPYAARASEAGWQFVWSRGAAPAD